MAALTVAAALLASVTLRRSALATLGVGAGVWFVGERLLGRFG